MAKQKPTHTNTKVLKCRSSASIESSPAVTQHPSAPEIKQLAKAVFAIKVSNIFQQILVSFLFLLAQSDILMRESRITFLVITLVVFFLICHTPNAVYTLYKSWLNNRQTFTNESKIKNLILGKFRLQGRRRQEKSFSFWL